MNVVNVVKVLLDFRYRCPECGDPMLRDGGNRHTPGQVSAIWLCVGPSTCPLQGKRFAVPLTYINAEPVCEERI